MWKIFFITFGALTTIEAIYLWIKWDQIQMLITGMKKIGEVKKMVGNMFGGDMLEGLNNIKKPFKVKVATFIGNYIEHTWLWVSLILIINLIISFALSMVIHLMILIVNLLM